MRRTVALYAETAPQNPADARADGQGTKGADQNGRYRQGEGGICRVRDGLGSEISPIHLVCQQPDFIAAAKNKKTPVQSPRCPKYRACEKQDRRGFGSEGRSRKVGLVQRKREGLRGLVR